MSSNGNFYALLAICAGNSPFAGVLMLSLICVWINGWVNNREACDLRRHRAHYAVIVIARNANDNRHHQSDTCNDNVMIWKQFPHYWPFVMANHQLILFKKDLECGVFALSYWLPEEAVEKTVVSVLRRIEAHATPQKYAFYVGLLFDKSNIVYQWDPEARTNANR